MGIGYINTFSNLLIPLYRQVVFYIAGDNFAYRGASTAKPETGSNRVVLFVGSRLNTIIEEAIPAELNTDGTEKTPAVPAVEDTRSNEAAIGAFVGAIIRAGVSQQISAVGYTKSSGTLDALTHASIGYKDGGEGLTIDDAADSSNFGKSIDDLQYLTVLDEIAKLVVTPYRRDSRPKHTQLSLIHI